MNDDIRTADNDTFNVALGARLRQLRQRHGLTRHDVEHQTGGAIKCTVLGSYERAEREPGIRRLLQLATLYDVSVDDLLRGLDDNPPVRSTAMADRVATLATELLDIAGELRDMTGRGDV